MTTSNDPVFQALLATQHPPPPQLTKPAPDRDASAVADSIQRLLRACQAATDTLAGEDDLRDQLGDIEAILAGRPLHTRGSDAENGATAGWESADDLGATGATCGGRASRPGVSRGGVGDTASGRESESFDEEVAAIGTTLQARAPFLLCARAAPCTRSAGTPHGSVP